MGSLNAVTPDQSNGADSYGPAQMAGGDQPQPGQDSSIPNSGVGDSPESQSNQLSAVVSQVRTMEDAILQLAQQFPQAATEARQTVEAVRRLLQRIVSTPGPETEPPSPRSMA